MKKSKLCWLCEREFSPADLEKGGLGGKVRDHCHCTGRFRGAAHNKCNLDCRIPTFIPVVFHNLSGYDAHLFVKNLGVEECNTNCIPKKEEKYISFTKELIVDTFKKEPESKEIKVKRGLRFIDSFKFMATGLDKLVSNLQKYENTQQYFTDTDTDLLLQKGVFPYEYVGEYKRLEETSLPPQSAFYSKLDDEGITDDSYKHAKRVFSEFRCRSIRDYLELYNKTDVPLLADVFENFRDVCMKNYLLDPAHYYKAPGLAWDAALKTTKIRLELITDPDMLIVFANGIRGVYR